MKHLDLFSGIGGFALAARWAGLETVAFCERDQFCQSVLSKQWPETTIHDDVRFLDGTEYRGIDIITGGYPCQPFSVAGSQKAENDDRHLWPEMRRIVAQAKPAWVICENVYGHIALGLDDVLHDLEGLGYASQPFVIPALAAGANHNRERIFIVANATSNGCNEGSPAGSHEAANDNSPRWQKEDCNHERRSGLRLGMDWRSGTPWGWGIEPPALRVDDGLPDRMDRNRALGNAIAPQIAYELLRTICDV